MTQKKTFYKYKGPVFRFEHVVINKWEAVTEAVSPQQALNNLAYRAKMELNLSCKAKLTLDPKCLKGGITCTQISK